MRHRVYFSIISAVNERRLHEPFCVADFRRCCPGFAEGTYKNFLNKHKKGNNGNTELFCRVSRGMYKLLMPLKYQ